MNEWVDSIKSVDEGRIKVEKRDSGIRIGKVDTSAPKIAVLHTIEFPTVLSGYPRGCPTIDAGPTTKGGRAVTRQFIPLGWMATALQNDAGGVETNRRVLIQIEQAGFTARELWLPSTEMQVILASWAEFFQEELGIPQRYPYVPEDMRSGIWATEGNPWRRSGKFMKLAGWHPHAAVPENDHWDCGGEDVQAILDRDARPEMVTAFQYAATWTGKNDHREVEQIGPFVARKNQLRTWAVKDSSVRWALWKHLRTKGHRVFIAERRVKTDLVKR